MNAKPIVLAIAVVAGIAIFPAFFANVPSRIIEDDQIPLEDITEELGGACFSYRSRSSHTYCSVEDFSFSDSYEIILVTTSHQLCETPGLASPRIIEKVAGVYFIISPNIAGSNYCAFRLTVQFENGERVFFGALVLWGGPRPEDVQRRYDFDLTHPMNGRPIAGMIYDRETDEISYIVTRMIY